MMHKTLVQHQNVEANIFTADLQLSNESKKDTGGNDVDGTWGDYTIQELW